MKRALIGLAAMAAMSQAWAADEARKDGPTGLDSKEATIPFLNQNALNSWRADGQMGLWVQDSRKQWYYATLFAPCQGLEFTAQVGFRNKVLNQLNRDSEVLLSNGQRCSFSSLRKSDAPPGEGKSAFNREESKQDSAAPAAK
jgi:hypothetical protein